MELIYGKMIYLNKSKSIPFPFKKLNTIFTDYAIEPRKRLDRTTKVFLVSYAKKNRNLLAFALHLANMGFLSVHITYRNTYCLSYHLEMLVLLAKINASSRFGFNKTPIFIFVFCLHFFESKYIEQPIHNERK